jgi:hypothetical protein
VYLGTNLKLKILSIYHTLFGTTAYYPAILHVMSIDFKITQEHAFIPFFHIYFSQFGPDRSSEAAAAAAADRVSPT